MTDHSTRDLAFRAAEQSAVVCDATGLTTLRIEGEDATAFLQGQLSSDVAALAPGMTQWSSYNSPKGRMLANFRLWRYSDRAYGALIAADLAGAVAKRLSMFVLRSKVRIVDSSQDVAVIGVGGPRAGDALQTGLGMSPRADAVIATDVPQATVAGLGDTRFAIVVDKAHAPAVHAALAPVAAPADAAVWRWLSIAAGVPLVTAATSDQFVPQMLNWDAIGGISFQKGCYPGQEIVARMRYLGRLKERLYRFEVSAEREPQPGTRIYGAAFGATPCGTVVNAAPAPQRGYAVLAVVQIDAMETGVLTLETENGAPLSPVALPYPVMDATAARKRLG